MKKNIIGDTMTPQKRLNRENCFDKFLTRVAMILFSLVWILGAMLIAKNLYDFLKEKDCTQVNTVEFIEIKPLPKLNFNWTPINDRTEKPTDLPIIRFNKLEK